MDIKKSKLINIPSSEITPEHIYISRRRFLKTAIAVAGGAFVAACSPIPTAFPATATPSPSQTTTTPTDEYGNPVSSYDHITSFNNFYEFTYDKKQVKTVAKDFPTSPWKVEIKGLVNNPVTLDVDDLVKRYAQEERIYRMLCVEGWWMVIPWVGFSLASLLKDVEPQGSANYIKFTTLYNPDLMKNQQGSSFIWPYTEGLRLDEAYHDLTMMATGIYGKPLEPQSGAPLRLVVPWKFGYKSIKSIVSIELVEEKPPTFWNIAAPYQYGFYSNVKPFAPDPDAPRPTVLPGQILPYNGYSDQVASLYTGMDPGEQY